MLRCKSQTWHMMHSARKRELQEGILCTVHASIDVCVDVRQNFAGGIDRRPFAGARGRLCVEDERSSASKITFLRAKGAAVLMDDRADPARNRTGACRRADTALSCIQTIQDVVECYRTNLSLSRHRRALRTSMRHLSSEF